jgi:hypothetical protein
MKVGSRGKIVNDLLDFVVDRHGGLDRWQAATTLSATFHLSGPLWRLKARSDLIGPVHLVADIHRQRSSIAPFGPDAQLDFDADADRVVITRGVQAATVDSPRRIMAAYPREHPWSLAEAGYFIAYASRMYLLEPFLLTLPGVRTREIEPWSEDGETWRRLEVRFPRQLATHSAVQTYYFDAETGLQRRIDYAPEVTANTPTAHYTSEHRDFDGLIVPTRRRMLGRDEHGVADHSGANILLDVHDLRLGTKTTAGSASFADHPSPTSTKRR